MAAPSEVVVLVCENEITQGALTLVCGHWLVLTRGEELPHCHACKKPQRTWRVVTDREIERRDRLFLQAIERMVFIGPDDR